MALTKLSRKIFAAEGKRWKMFAKRTNFVIPSFSAIGNLDDDGGMQLALPFAERRSATHGEEDEPDVARESALDSALDGVRDRFFALVDAAELDEDRARDWVIVRMLVNLKDEVAVAVPDREAITRWITLAKAVQ